MRSGLSISRETDERLAAYTDLVTRWNPRLNLVGRRELARMRHGHVEECRQLANYMRPGVSLALDMGSGAGLPGLVLAICTGVEFILVEADRRKAAFLREAVRLTSAPAVIHATRLELEAAQVDLVTARALAPLSTLLEWAHPLLRPGATCLFLKGSHLEQELEEATQHWSMRVDVHSATIPPGRPLSGTDRLPTSKRERLASTSRIVEIQELSPLRHESG